MYFVNQDLVVVLVGFVKGHVNLDELKSWLAENIWTLSRSASPLDWMILGELEIALAEFDRGDRDELYLLEHIKFLLILPNPGLVPALRDSAVA